MEKDFRQMIAFAEKRQKAVALLIGKAREKGALPIKSDFDESEIMLIKNTLNSFPRALETAGLKEVSERYRQKLARKKDKYRH